MAYHRQDANFGDSALAVKRAFYQARDFVPQRIVLRVEAGDDVPLAIEQELVEVPGDLARKLRVRRLVREERVEGMDGLALHGDLREHRERDTVRQAAKALDLGFRSWLLPHEVIRWETEYLESAIVETRIKHLQVLVLGRETALAGHVHDEKYLP